MWSAGRLSWKMLAALSLTAVPVSQAHAQYAAPDGAPAPVDVAQAAALRAQATSMYQDRSRYRDAAQLLVQASQLTPVEEATRVSDLVTAANLLYDSGSVSGAQAVMVQAADAALARGDIAAAAGALVDAAWLATMRHSAGDARELALRALHLTASPQLTPEQRDAIRRRVVLPGRQGVSETGATAQARTGWSVAAQQSTRVHG